MYRNEDEMIHCCGGIAETALGSAQLATTAHDPPDAPGDSAPHPNKQKISTPIKPTLCTKLNCTRTPFENSFQTISSYWLFENRTTKS
jgi:hypothetical protein